MRIGVVCVIKESWGGSEELWAAMAHEAIASGHEIIVSAYDCGNIHPKMQALIEKGVTLIYRRGYVKPNIPAWKRILNKASVILLNRLNNPFKKFIDSRLDLTLYNGTSYSCIEDLQLFNALISRKINYDYLSHIAADYYRPVGLAEVPVIANIFKNARTNYFVADRTIKITERQIGSTIPNKTIVRNPVNLKNINRVIYPSIHSQINFATVGLLVAAHKGQDMLFEVLSADNWKKRNWHLNIYGSGVDENFLKQLAIFYNIQDRVTFHGKVNDVRDIWQKNHLLLMTSLMEGMPLAVVEAMLCGRPCLVTDVGDHTAWIQDKQEGFIADAPSPPSIAKTLENAWQNQNSWQEMGLNAHNKALLLYDSKPGKTFLNFLVSKHN
ncbi:MAG: glycosyltransferase [Bacteroidota bacterium]